jgi:hypothetical protein
MSKSLSILVFLKKQKTDSRETAPLYVRITIDGDTDEFSVSRRILVTDWSQTKQKSTAKSQEASQLNAKIAKIKGDLTTLFDRIPVCELVKAKQLIQLYHGKDAQSEQQLKKDLQYHQQVLKIIDQYVVLKNTEKKATGKQLQGSYPNPLNEQFDGIIQTIEEFLRQSRLWMDDPYIDKTLMDAQYTFLLKFLYKVLKGTASHETFRKWPITTPLPLLVQSNPNDYRTGQRKPPPSRMVPWRAV